MRLAALTVSGAALGAAAAVLLARGVLRRQAAIARRRIGKPLGEIAPAADRVWRRTNDGTPVELLMLGDSIAAGLGATRRKDTPGARLAKGLARATHRPVRLRTATVVGSESAMLGAQLDGLPVDYRPDVAVIVVGGNDVTHRVPVAQAVARLEEAIRRVRDRGAVVVVGTCPDLGALRAVPQPLRALASRLSRQLADAQGAAAVAAGADVVRLHRAVGPIFLSQPEEMFSLDRFHPSALGYRRTADAMLPAVVVALSRAASPRLDRPPAGRHDRTVTLRIRTVLAPQGPATAIELTDAQVDELGGGKRAAVRVTIGDRTARLRLGVMGGRNLIGLSKAARAELGVEIGDTVDAIIAVDAAERDVEIPDDLAAALDADPKVRAAFDALAFTHRKEHVRAVNEAKQAATRERRIAATVEKVRAALDAS